MTRLHEFTDKTFALPSIQCLSPKGGLTQNIQYEIFL